MLRGLALLFLFLLVQGQTRLCAQPSQTEGESEQQSQPQVSADGEFPDLTIPPDADVAALQDIVARAKKVQPRTAEQYYAQQTALKDAASALIKLLKKDDPAYAQAEMDVIIASVSLMTFFTEDEQTDVVEQVKEYLKKKQPLAMQDVQAGMMAAGMLELQPYKEPSREIYQLLDELLQDDSREEMQSLRLNLQAAVRRLGMLGKRFELDAVALDGQRIRTEDFEGKFVIVDMFATWCQPCLAELPLILSHYEKYKSKGLEVVGISLDNDPETIQKHLEANPLPWPVIHDGAADPLERLALKYGVSALPTVLLLNKEGTVVSLEARQSELNRLMQMLFESPTPAAEKPDKTDQADQTDQEAESVTDSTNNSDTPKE